MTREEAKRRMEICRDFLANNYSDMGEANFTAFNMAIKALSQEPTNEKELNKAYTFGHNKGVKAYYNEQLCTVELPEAVFRYILSLVPTEEAEQEPCEDAISREAVYSILKEYHIDEEEIESTMDDCQNLTVNAITSDVSLLPPVSTTKNIVNHGTMNITL